MPYLYRIYNFSFMRIGFEAKRAIQNHTGLGNYSRYIIAILSKYYPENSYVLFAPKNRQNAKLESISSKNKNISFVFPPRKHKIWASLWRLWRIKKSIGKHQVDIFHGLSNELPIGIKGARTKTVVTIHDLIFLRFPEYYKLIDRLIYRIKFRYACRKTDKIIAVSECTKRDIVSFFHIPEEKIEVIYQGCQAAFREEADQETKDRIRLKYQLPQRFLLNVGSIENRKNLLLIAKSLKQLPEDIHLVAIGKSTPYQQEIEEFVRKERLTSRVHIFNRIETNELPAFYQLSEIFIYPSFFEGFGIPIIEALSCRVPVIAAQGSCLEEAGGPDSIYIDPNNEEELAEQVIRILTQPELKKQMIDAGEQYIRRFSEEKIAEELMYLYKNLQKK